VRQFTFSSHLQRQSVIISDVNTGETYFRIDSFNLKIYQFSGDLTLYCKGAPEKIASLCIPSTLPSTLQPMLNNLANRGYRLIAFAQRPLAGVVSTVRSAFIK
jgi:cation-transporting ATPase 13A2